MTLQSSEQNTSNATYVDKLTMFAPPFAYFAECDLPAVSRIFDERVLAVDDITLRFVRGEQCLSPGELHQQWGNAWQFPDHLSHLWDAFAGAITDMKWFHARNYLTVITQSHRLYEDSSTRDLAAPGVLLNAAATYWADPPLKPPTWHPNPISFHVVFQCEPKYATKTRARLQSAGIVAPDLFTEH